VTSPGTDPQDFAFTSNITGNTTFSLDNDPGNGALPNSQTFLVTSGTYTVTEGIVPGWDLSDLSCSAGGSGDTGTRTATITVNPGDTVSCTFTNAKLGTIAIVKDAVPNHPQDFAFTSDIPGNAAFSLDDDADATLPTSLTFINLAAGSYTVTESIVANWSVSNISCVDPTSNSTGDTGTRTATINVAPGETVTCTFTNTAAPATITIEKIAVANPANDPQDFSFSATGPTVIPAFQLDDDGAAGNPLSDTITLAGLTPGTYTVTEGPVAGWNLTGLSCNDGDSTGNIGTGTATIIVDPAETVQCTFTNTKRGTIVINKVTNPASDPQDFAFSSTITGSTSFSLDTDAGDPTLPNSQTLTAPPGAYSVTEQAVTGWNLTALDCVDTVGGGSSGNLGTRTASINISAGETVTCTFTNTAQPGTITITKNAIPNDPQDFGYVLTGVSTNTIFSLDDDGNPTLPNSRTFTGLAQGTYNVI
jgi:plastocyanin